MTHAWRSAAAGAARAVPWLFLPVDADELSFGEDVALHRLFEIDARGPLELGEHRVEREHSEDVTVLAARRAGGAVASAAGVVDALARAVRQIGGLLDVLFERMNGGRNIEHDPMRISALRRLGRVRIEHDEREATRTGRRRGRLHRRE